MGPVELVEPAEVPAPQPLESPERAELLERSEPELATGNWQLETAPDVTIDPRYTRIGAEGLARLRARYAEIMARIAERATDESAEEQLRVKAERLNPDAWVTEDEVALALEQYETVFEELRPLVGRHPRPRRRGRRRV